MTIAITNYVGNIIIRNGRIEVAVAKNGMEMLHAASRTAAALVAYYGEKLTAADALPISELQHQMMELLEARDSYRNAGEMVKEMFELLDELERKIG